MIECQAGYVRQAIGRLASGARPLAVHPEVADSFGMEMQERLGAGPARSVTDWPGTMREYERRTAHFDDADYLAT